jgi:hypothetical protein
MPDGAKMIKEWIFNLGYAFALAANMTMLYIMLGIAKYGKLVVTEPNKYILYSEIIWLSFGLIILIILTINYVKENKYKLRGGD